MRVREFSTPMRGEDMPYPGCINVVLVEDGNRVMILMFDNETMILQGWAGVNEHSNPALNQDMHDRLVVNEKVTLPPETEYIR